MHMQTVLLVGTPERRESMKQVLRQCQPLDVVGEIATADALRLVPRLAPDLVILDCASPQINPLAVLPALAAPVDAPRVVVLGAHNSQGERDLLLGLGAAEYASLERPHSIVEALAGTAAPRHKPATSRRTRRVGGVWHRQVSSAK